MLDAYAAKYHSLKAPRKLQWKPNLGTVSLSVSVGGTAAVFSVPPAHAAILMQFSGGQELHTEELADVVGLKPRALRRKIVYWVNQGEASVPA